MQVQNHQTFKGISPYSSAVFMENNVLMNKALFDLAGSDVPWVVMANNKEERRERTNRAMLSFGLIFISPLVILPLVNRASMKYIAKLTPKLMAKEYNAIRLSNKHLINTQKTEAGLAALERKYKGKVNFDSLKEKADGDFEKIRLGIIKAKNAVLAADFLLVGGAFGSIGFFNAHQTKKKTGQSGYSAEMEMADKSVVEKRARKYEKTAGLRLGTFLTLLGGLIVGVPLAMKHGLSSNKATKFNSFVKKHAKKLDYVDAIFAKRWAMALSLAVAQSGICLASRNKTELKDNAIRSSVGFAIFFGGDLLLARLFSNLSDKLFKTKLVDYTHKKDKFMHKILPPVKPLRGIEQLKHSKTKGAAGAIFWLTFALTAASTGVIVPYLINKLIKKDVEKDVNSSKANN